MWQIINNLIGNILVTFGLFFFVKITLDKSLNLSKKRLTIYFVLSAIIYTVIMACFAGMIKTILMGIIMIWFNKEIFCEGYKKAIFLAFLYLITLLIMELFGLWLLIDILNMSKEFCYNEFAGSVICNLFIQLLTIVAALCLKKLFRKLINAKIENYTKIIIYSILIWICSMMFLYTIIKEFRFSNNILLYLLSIGVLITVLFSLIKQTIQNSKLTSKYDKLLEYMTTYEIDIENQKILRHEAKNELRTIRAKINDNQKNEEIIEYIDELVNDKYEIKQEKYAKFGYLPANGIKGLCYFKVQEAEKKGINISLNISKKVKNSSIYNLNIKQQRDFGRILGVVFDNAIEASENSKDKQIGIEAYANTNNEFKMIISNTYSNKVEKTKIGLENFSTKGNNRGYGLLLVKQIVEKNTIFETKTNIQNNIFVQTIIIKNCCKTK